MKSTAIDRNKQRNLSRVMYLTALDKDNKPLEVMTIRAYIWSGKHYAVLTLYDGKTSYYADGLDKTLGGAIQAALDAMEVPTEGVTLIRYSDESLVATMKSLCERMGLKPLVGGWINS